MNLRAEERLLLALGKLDPDARDRRAARACLAGLTGLDWGRALELARYHRVHALLAANLADEPGLPDGVRATLGRFRLAAELRNERYFHAAAPALARLAAQGVAVVLLKGAALATTVYPPGTRPLHDLDLLISRRDYPRAARALQELGFARVLPPGRSERGTLRDYHEMGFVKRAGRETLGLDLHWRVYPRDRPYALPVSTILAGARPVAAGPLRALVPAPEHTFIHLATQIVNDGLAVHLGRVADLHALTRRDLDWNRLVAAARRARAAGATRLALALATLAGAKVPAGVVRRLEGACSASRAATSVVAVPRFLFQSDALRFGARDACLPLFYGLRPRLAYLLSLPLPRRAQGPHAAESFGAYLRRLREVGVVALCGALLLALRAAEAAGRHGWAARLRETLWRPQPAAAEAPADTAHAGAPATQQVSAPS